MQETFYKKNFLLFWIHWHFIYASKEIIKGWKNILIFNFNFFSISFLLKTIFLYWHKYQWHYDKSFNFTRYLNVFFSNLISRFLGAIIRISLIIIGLLSEIFIVFAGAFILISWFLLPLFSIFGIITGFILIYYYGGIF